MRADTGYAPGEYFRATCKQVGVFYKENGRWPSRESKDKEEKRLGTWCHKIKLKYRHGGLDENRLRLLEEINFSFHPKKDVWKKNVHELKEYFDKGILPPYKSKLRSFAYYLYSHFDQMPAERKEKLNSIRFIEHYRKFSLFDEDLWERNFLATVNFFHTYQRLPTRITNATLEGWLSKQRQLLKKGALSEDRIGLFNEAGIDLLKGSFRKTPWEEEYEQLKNFVLTHHRFPTLESDQKLFSWLRYQNKRYKSGKMEAQQIKTMEAIGHRWKLQKKRAA